MTRPVSSNPDAHSSTQNGESAQDKNDGIPLHAHIAGSGTLDRLVGTARAYTRAAAPDTTLKAYTKDWAHFARWCRMKGAEPLPPSPELIGLYLANLASGLNPLPCAVGVPTSIGFHNRLA